jgi:hypothetical protein
MHPSALPSSPLTSFLPLSISYADGCRLARLAARLAGFFTYS